MSPEDEIRVREIIAERPVQTLLYESERWRSRRARRHEAEIRPVVEMMLREYSEAMERRQRNAVVNAVMAHQKRTQGAT